MVGDRREKRFGVSSFQQDDGGWVFRSFEGGDSGARGGAMAITSADESRRNVDRASTSTDDVAIAVDASPRVRLPLARFPRSEAFDGFLGLWRRFAGCVAGTRRSRVTRRSKRNWEVTRTIFMGCLRTSDSTAHLVGPVSD